MRKLARALLMGNGTKTKNPFEAIPLIAMIIAIASSPRLAERAQRYWWSRIAELVVGVAAFVLCVFLLMDHFLIPVLVHITVAGIELAQPLPFASESLAAYDTGRLARFFDITTAGAVSVLVSCILLRLFSHAWWRGARWRACCGVLFAVSLMATIALSVRIVWVEVPGISHALAARSAQRFSRSGEE